MPYAPGESGNPAGRPRGARGRAAVLRESIDAEIPEIIQSLIRQAKDGDVAACRLLLERCLPPVRASGPSVETDLPDFETGDLKTRSEAVIAAMGRGDIATDVGASLMSALNVQSNILEAHDLAERVSRLEETLSVRNP